MVVVVCCHSVRDYFGNSDKDYVLSDINATAVIYFVSGRASIEIPEKRAREPFGARLVFLRVKMRKVRSVAVYQTHVL